MRTRTRWIRLAVASAGVVASLAACVAPPPPPPPPPPGPPHPLKISYFGDSVPYTYAFGALVTNATIAGDILPVPGSLRIGCAVGRYTKYQPNDTNPTGDTKVLCDWSLDHTVDGVTAISYQHTVEQNPTDMAIVNFCGWDVIPRRIPLGPGVWDDVYRSMGDPIYEDYLRSEFRLMTDLLLAGGARSVVLVTCGTWMDPVTMEPRWLAPDLWKWRDLVRSLPTTDPRLHIIDLGAWLDAQPDWTFFRPDGQHFSETSPRVVADTYFDAQLLALADQLW